MLFQMKEKVGPHVDEKGKKYKSGDFIESDRPLDKIMPHKFTEVTDGGVEGKNAPVRPEIPGPVSGGDGHAVASSPEIEASPHGTDVTEKFELAKAAKLQVFENNKWYTIIDPEDDTVITDKKIRRKQIDGVLKDFIPEEE